MNFTSKFHGMSNLVMRSYRLPKSLISEMERFSMKQNLTLSDIVRDSVSKHIKTRKHTRKRP